MARLGIRTFAYKTIEGGEPGATVILGDNSATSSGAEPLFQVASISKPVSAFGILRLVDQRHLDLDADINSYLKSWHIDYRGYPAGTKVTIRQLLSHTAGTTVHGFAGYAPDEARPGTLGVLEGKGNSEPVKLFQAPETGFSYSGGGTTILQLLVEDLTGQTFPDYMADAVLKPFGMTASHYRDEPGAPYVPATGGRGEDMGAPYHVYPEKAAASLWTTPSDLARFLLVADAVIAGKRPDILSRALAAEMVRIPGGGDEGYALGFAVKRAERLEVISHSGSNFGYKSFMFLDRRTHDGFVAMSGSEQGYVLNDRLARGFAQERGLPYLAQRHLRTVVQSEADWAQIVGLWSYDIGNGQPQTFRVEQLAPDELSAVNVASGERFDFFATGPLQFVDPDKGVPLSFAVDAEGRFGGLVYGQVPLVRAN